eukprot:6200323-Pleurochrysis_carterae.AAC.1
MMYVCANLDFIVRQYTVCSLRVGARGQASVCVPEGSRSGSSCAWRNHTRGSRLSAVSECILDEIDRRRTRPLFARSRLLYDKAQR